MNEFLFRIAPLLTVAAPIAIPVCSVAQNTAPTAPRTSVQSPSTTQAMGVGAPAAAASAQKPSGLIAPAVDQLSMTVSRIRLERWKGGVRDEVDTNLRSVERDVATTLPPLVKAADAQPASVAASLPLLRNLDALCAVVIRVSVVARANAPAADEDDLAQALKVLQGARNSLSDQVQTLAAAQEKSLADLTSANATLHAQLTAAQQVPTSPAVAPAKKRHGPKAAKPAQ